MAAILENVKHVRFDYAFPLAVDTRAADAEAMRRETRDCTVRAFAVWSGIGYAEAHAIMRADGRPDREGFFPHETLDRYAQRIKLYRAPIESSQSGRYKMPSRVTVGRFALENPRGRFYCIVRGHALAIINGTIYDWWPRPRRILLHVWKF